MKIITHDDIVNLNISAQDCYKWVVEALMNKDKVILPPKISLKPYAGVFCNIMPSVIFYDNDLSVGGIKVVTRYPQRKPSLDSKIIIFDAISGEFKAIMDANWITAMRTGAVAVHSIKLFSKKDYSEIGIIGLGNASRSTVLMLSELEKEKKLTIKLFKYKNQHELFKKRFKRYKNLKFVYVDTPEELISGSDVIISAATYLPDNVCTDNKCYKEGVTVIPIHTLGFTNCDLFFDKVFADDTGHVEHFKYFNQFKKYAEVSNVVKGKAKGRESPTERILVYNIGISMHDINYAINIYNLLLNKKCQIIDFKEPKDKFWI